MCHLTWKRIVTRVRSGYRKSYLCQPCSSINPILRGRYIYIFAFVCGSNCDPSSETYRCNNNSRNYHFQSGCAGNWLRTITSDRTVHDNSSLSFLSSPIRWIRDYWEAITSLFWKKAKRKNERTNGTDGDVYSKCFTCISEILSLSILTFK